MTPRIKSQVRKGLKYGGTAMGLALLFGCTTLKDQNGHLIDDEMMNYVTEGVDNKDSVATMLGRPSLTATFDDETWYYVSQLTEQFAFLTPEAIHHRVVAISFDDKGNVAQIENFNKEQIVQVNLSGDKTPTRGRELGFLEQVFGNIGQVGTLPGQQGPGGPGTP